MLHYFTRLTLIITVYKCGLIQPGYYETREDTVGDAIAGRGADRELDLYFDFRVATDQIRYPPDYVDPPSVSDLISRARKFAATHSAARFAALRLWSAPHFYPLMIGWDSRQPTSFADGLGRTWEWKFIPKDMPCSEWSIHRQLQLRIKPFQHVLGHRVVVKKDLLLVLGTDEEDLLKYSTAATFAIQTEPWRLEVDLWRSFVNVDVAFLEGLQEEWLD